MKKLQAGLAVAVFAGAVAVATGCGSDGDDSSEPPQGEAGAPASTATQGSDAPDATTGGADAAADAATDASADATVSTATDAGAGADSGAATDAGTDAGADAGSSVDGGSPGCGTSGATGVQTLSMSVDGATHTGMFVVPAGYDPSHAYPLVFVFHDGGGTGATIRTLLNMEPDAAGKAIFVYLDGTNQAWNMAYAGTNSDMDFVLAARDQLRQQYCVDRGRTFAAGFSVGGHFANQLACRYGTGEITAVASASGAISTDNDGAYVYGPPDPRGGPYMEMGNYDFMCPVDGTPSDTPPLPMLPPPAFVIGGECDTEQGVAYAEQRAVAEHWGFAARCSTTPAVAVTTSPNPSCSAGQISSDPVLTVDPCYVAPGCAGGHDVTFCAIPGMGHSLWADAHTRMWSFFASH